MNDNKSKQRQSGATRTVQAVIFDLDGVITDTAEAHARAWKRMFDEYLQTLGERQGKTYRRFDLEKDYLPYVDGKPRYEGVKSFLEARGIDLEFGSPDDPPERETVCGLGNRKNDIYQEFIESGGVKVYPEAVDVIRRLRSERIKTAVVSSSKNCRRVLEAAGIEDLFDARVDGLVSEQLDLKGKPAPDIFLKAAEQLEVPPPSAVVVEDAVAGVQAGRRGGFGCVVGIDRQGQSPGLKDHGADRVIGDLAEIDFASLPLKRGSTHLPSALEHLKTIAGGRESKKVALFLDYDGTLSPIVERPEQADLAPGMRATLKSIAKRCTVAIVSGRGLEDVRSRVGLENLFYAGSHGFEIDGPGRERIRNEKGTDALPALGQAETMLAERLAAIEGAQVERKKYSVAVHYRRVADRQAGAVEDIVNEVAKQLSGLRKGRGKKVFELQPDIDWDKGRAVSWLMERLGLDTGGVQPIYIGDDVTDEDAFRLLQGYGTGIIVHGRQARLTYADYGLTDTEDVQRFLQQLTEELDGGA